MSSKSNDNGRAFEYIFIQTLYSKLLTVNSNTFIENNSSLKAAELAFRKVDNVIKNNLQNSSDAVCKILFDLEPFLNTNYNENSYFRLAIQSDSKGIIGDVRDIVISYQNKYDTNNVIWEIGFSLKHNHFAVKHSRLSPKIDFGKEWFNIPCSDNYWKEIKPVFDFTNEYKIKNLNWSDLGVSKENKVYFPLLNAFINEIKYCYQKDNNLPNKMVQYLLGVFDFYKVISEDKQNLAQIQGFNLYGTLNKGCKNELYLIPKVLLPTRIINIDFKPNSKNTIELFLDNDWTFSFRIHNASTKIENSLKFDIQIVGMPISIITLNRNWF